MIEYEWWAISEKIGKERHLTGMDRTIVVLPDLYRTKKGAEFAVAEWKLESPAVKTWGLKAVRVTIAMKEGK